jgi:hypothetical protein
MVKLDGWLCCFPAAAALLETGRQVMAPATYGDGVEVQPLTEPMDKGIDCLSSQPLVTCDHTDVLLLCQHSILLLLAEAVQEATLCHDYYLTGCCTVAGVASIRVVTVSWLQLLLTVLQRSSKLMLPRERVSAVALQQATG